MVSSSMSSSTNPSGIVTSEVTNLQRYEVAHPVEPRQTPQPSCEDNAEETCNDY